MRTIFEQFRQTSWAAIQFIFHSSTLTESEKQLRIRFLGNILPIIVPILVLLQIARAILSEESSAKTLLSFVAYFGTIVSIYLIIRTKRYYLIITSVYLLGTILIIGNALASKPPHIEITYMLILPLVSSMLLSMRETIYWSFATILIMFLFANLLIAPNSQDIYSDIIHITIVFNVFILFAGYQRDRLEKDRSALALISGRTELLQFLLNSISHDIRTPLSIIHTSLYLLKRSLTDERQLQRIDKITAQADHLNQLVEDIFTLSKLEYTHPEFVEDCDLAELAMQAIRDVKLQAAARQVMILTDFEENLPMLPSNDEDLLRIISHLLQNAIQYNNTGGEVTVRIFKQESALYLNVKDTGVGISDIDLPHIFEPFYRGDKSRTGNEVNSGLGLTLVQKTVDLYGGTIEVTSVIGQGTTVQVIFPLPGPPRHGLWGRF